MAIVDPDGIDAVLLDIEGTTTPVSFVYDVLFPYAREAIEEFLESAPVDAVEDDLEALRREHRLDLDEGLDPPPWEAAGDMTEAAGYARWLMDRDRKSTPLKSLQGKVWRRGYREGELEGRVYAEVPSALERWREQGRELYIYSSGSVEAQKLLYSTTPAGDLTRLIDGHFDTNTGAKTEAASYAAIGRAIGVDPPAVLFVSDVVAELNAAAEAGMRTALCVREEEDADVADDGAAGAASSHPRVQDLNQVLP